jgi:hypothetical protein
MLTRPHPLRRLLALIPLLALVAGCAEPKAPPLARVASLPDNELILLATAPYNSSDEHGFYLLDPASGALSAWQLQGGRGIVENGSSCYTADNQQRWDPERRELVFSASLGCVEGLYYIGADGAVKQEPLPALPAGVEYPQHHISAPDRSASAVTGVIYRQPAGTGGDRYIYVAEPGADWTSYGAGMGFEEIYYLRWSPDSRSLAFVAGIRSGDGFHRRAYLLDLERDKLRALSQDEALIDSEPIFTPDGAVIFTAAADGAPPAIYLAEPGAEAFPIVDLGALPNAASWRGELTLSPDGRLAALEAMRDSPTTPRTIYVADLESGELRDLLPADQPVERGGEATQEAPGISPLVWSPDSLRLLAVADFAGICYEIPVSGAITCSDQLYTLPADGGAPSRIGDAQLIGASFAFWLN